MTVMLSFLLPGTLLNTDMRSGFGVRNHQWSWLLSTERNLQEGVSKSIPKTRPQAFGDRHGHWRDCPHGTYDRQSIHHRSCESTVIEHTL